MAHLTHGDFCEKQTHKIAFFQLLESSIIHRAVRRGSFPHFLFPFPKADTHSFLRHAVGSMSAGVVSFQGE